MKQKRPRTLDSYLLTSPDGSHLWVAEMAEIDGAYRVSVATVPVDSVFPCRCDKIEHFESAESAKRHIQIIVVKRLRDGWPESNLLHDLPLLVHKPLHRIDTRSMSSQTKPVFF